MLLSTEKNADEKKNILETEFNISMTKEMRKETSEMCDFSNYVEEKGIKKGIKKGEALLSTLIQRLIADGRSADIELAASDENARMQLYKEYNII